MSKLIGVLLEDAAKQGLTQDFFATIIEGFKQECNRSGFNILFLNQEETDRPTYLDQAKQFELDGVLIATATDSDELFELINSDVPVAVIDKDYENTVNVQSDNKKGMTELMEHIISLGHRKIAYIMGQESFVTNVRLNEFLKVCSDHEIHVPEEYLVRGEFRNIGLTAYNTEILLKLPDPPTCILYSDDYAAIGGMNVIGARGLEIPRDISVAGYDGNVILANIEPSITTVNQNNMEMGKVAAKKLIHNILNPDNPEYGTTTIESEFAYGRSVGQVYAAF